MDSQDGCETFNFKFKSMHNTFEYRYAFTPKKSHSMQMPVAVVMN